MDPFIGEIVLFAGNFAPRSWALCDGQLLAINSHSALFSILGTTYGGDGRTTFALPDLRGRTPVHPGHGPGLSDYDLGERGGTERVTLTVAQMPSHSHIASSSSKLYGQSAPGDDDTIGPGVALASGSGTSSEVYTSSAPNTEMNVNSVLTTTTILNNGGSQYHTNIQPFLGINYIIALQGIFPSRN
jgi:microcystin-dependent protein